MNGILVVGHGSRSKDAYNTFFKIVESLKAKTNKEVEGCFMEISAPYIPETVDKMYQNGVRAITVLPYFLYEGIHIKEDIPQMLREIKEEHADIKLEMAHPLGYHELLVEILIERVEGDKQCI